MFDLKKGKILLSVLILLVLTRALSGADGKKPFVWDCLSAPTALTVSVTVAPEHYLYQSETEVIVTTVSGTELSVQKVPETVMHYDDISEEDVPIYAAGIHRWVFAPITEDVTVTVSYQGCSEGSEGNPGICFIPDSEEFAVSASGTVAETGGETATSGALPENTARLLDAFEPIRTANGFLDKEKFLDFLSGNAEDTLGLTGGTWMLILVVLLGGLGLNLTPCVLPMIPINLAIIGAGSGKKRFSGLWRGSAYGAGMAIAYGILGVVVVLTKARFGELNSSPWFNFAIAVIFVILALAMFDKILIDFSRFSGKVDVKKLPVGAMIAAFLMGAIAALLAGACVAPVVIGVLLLSGTIYEGGNVLGLVLPFLLGIGMALPWPLAGAGFSILPKPGMWMNKLKMVFGILILIAAGYYGYLGWTLLPQEGESLSREEVTQEFARLDEALQKAQDNNKEVVIDFWATWCKNCTAMEHSTLRDPEVVRALDRYIVVKFQAEDLGEAANAALLDRFEIKGLPAFVLLKPVAK